MPELVSAELKAGTTPVPPNPSLKSAPSLLTRGEKLMSPAAAAQASNIPGHRGGTHVNGSTLFRWITRGVKTPGGVVRLEAVKVGTAWKTSLEAIVRFADALTAASIPTIHDTETPPAPTPKQRRSAADRASREADKVFGPANVEEQKA